MFSKLTSLSQLSERVRLSVILAAIAGSHLLLTFGFHWYVLTTVGPERETDALFASMIVPQVVLAIVSASLTHVLVPLLSAEPRGAARQDAWTFFHLVGGIFGGLALLFGATAHIWVPFIVPGFEAAAQRLTVDMTRIQLGGMIFTALTAVLWSYSYSERRFIWAEVSSTFAMAVAIAAVIIGLPRFGIMAAAWAWASRALVQMLLLIPVLGQYCLPDWRTRAVEVGWSRLRPLLFGASYYKLDILFDRLLASMAPAGGLSLLTLAQQIYTGGHQVLNKAISSPMVPQLAQLAQEDSWSGFIRTSRSRFFAMLAITVIGLLFIAILGRPILALVFGHGRFEARDMELLWLLLLALGGMWMGGAGGQILSASFYAKGNTITPTRIGVFGFTLGLFLKVGGFLLFGLLGLALAASLYYALNLILLYAFLGSHLKRQLEDVPRT